MCTIVALGDIYTLFMCTIVALGDSHASFDLLQFPTSHCYIINVS